ncbi:hypothetical protein ACOSQ4_001951 [Xanthoceras sorbifolium]
MTPIFYPILHSTLIYIDDILLFSSIEKDHRSLISQFCDIIQQYGIILSEKKSFIAQQEIDFLGMHISHGRYSPGLHIAHELLKFPDSNLSREQIQQFLSTVNYIRDFLPHVAQYTSHLSSLLKNTPPPWGAVHIDAPPPLHIPSNGLRILQTDASDCHWGALLFEKRDKKRFYCAYASGSFKSSQQHYHTIYKEILANKVPPDHLLLRLKSWFERYDFHTFHIKGSQNIIPDMLSRPQPIQLISKTSIIPVIYTLSPPMAEPFYDPSYILNLPAKHLLFFPPDLNQPFFASDYLYRYLHLLHTEYDHYHVTRHNKPFITPFLICSYHFSQNTLWYLWCLSVLYSHPIVLPLMQTSQHLHDPSNKNSLLWNFL